MTFTYTSTFPGLAASSGGTAAMIGAAIATATESGNTATITTTTPTGFAVGETVTIAGVNVAGYNGTFVIKSVVNPTTFIYTVGTKGLAAGSGGTATNLLLATFRSSTTPLSSIGIGNLLPSLTPAQIAVLVNTSLAHLKAGKSIEWIIANDILSNPAFFAQGGSTDAGFINQIYLDLLGIDLTSDAGLAGLEDTVRQQQASALVESTTYIDQYMNSALQTYLSETPQQFEQLHPGQLAKWEQQFLARTITDQQFIALLINTADFTSPTNLANILGQNTPYGGNEAVVRAMYKLLLPTTFAGLSADPGTDLNVNAWVTKLDHHTASRAQVATALIAMPVYYNDPTSGLVVQYFNKVFGASRLVSLSDIAAWAPKLQNGSLRVEQFLADLLATPEFYNDQLNGATTHVQHVTNWVNGMYQVAVGGPPSGTQLSNTVQAVLAVDTSLEQTLDAPSRLLVAGPLVETTAYIDPYMGGALQTYLGESQQTFEQAHPGLFAKWEKAFVARTITDQQFIAALISLPDFAAGGNLTRILGANSYSATEALVRAIYKVLLPTTYASLNPTAGADKTVNALVKALNAHTLTAGGIAASFIATPAYYNDPTNGLVVQYYHLVFGASRVVLPTEIANWAPKLQSGAVRVEQFLANLLSSQEYFNNNIGTATTQTDQDTNWVNAVYQLTTGNPAGGTQLSNALSTLSNAEQTARNKLATQTTASAAYHNHITTLVYQDLLGQTLDPSNPADAATLAHWNAVLSAPSAGPGKASNDEQMLISILGSQAYFNHQTDPSNGLHDNTAWAISLYTNLLIPLSATYANTVATILNNYAKARSQAIASILGSNEYLTSVVTAAYQTYLGRAPLAYEVSYWDSQLAGGKTEAYLVANLIAPNATVIKDLSVNATFNPQEFYGTRAPAVLGVSAANNATFVQAAYKLLFPSYTLPPFVLTQWTTFLAAAGTAYTPAVAAARASFAMTVITSPSSNNLMWFYGGPQDIVTTNGVQTVTGGRVAQIYFQLLGRFPTVDEINGWRKTNPAGVTDQVVIAKLTASPEYFNEHHPFP
jgi:hypothetical protein